MIMQSISFTRILLEYKFSGVKTFSIFDGISWCINIYLIENVKTYLKYLLNVLYVYEATINYKNRMKTGAQKFFRKKITHSTKLKFDSFNFRSKVFCHILLTCEIFQTWHNWVFQGVLCWNLRRIKISFTLKFLCVI